MNKIFSYILGACFALVFGIGHANAQGNGVPYQWINYAKETWHTGGPQIPLPLQGDIPGSEACDGTTINGVGQVTNCPGNALSGGTVWGATVTIGGTNSFVAVGSAHWMFNHASGEHIVSPDIAAHPPPLTGLLWLPTPTQTCAGWPVAQCNTTYGPPLYPNFVGLGLASKATPSWNVSGTNTGDVAYSVLPDGNTLLINSLYNIGGISANPWNGVTAVKLDFNGAASGHDVTGKVMIGPMVKLCNPSGNAYPNTLCWTGLYKIKMHCTQGDSGGLLVTLKTKQPVGVLVAKDGEGYCYFEPINTAVSDLSLTSFGSVSAGLAEAESDPDQAADMAAEAVTDQAIVDLGYYPFFQLSEAYGYVVGVEPSMNESTNTPQIDVYAAPGDAGLIEIPGTGEMDGIPIKIKYPPTDAQAL